ncbi:protein kinase superfamily protein [Wolffia australiana]
MASSGALAFYITICCAAFLTSKVVIAVLLYKRWLRKRRTMEQGFSGGKLVLFRSLTTAQSLPSRAFLKKTMKLTSKDIIGAGGYGTVYKLVVDGGAAAFAVKRLSRGSAERDKGFERELNAMGDVKHRNILTLHGYYTTPHFNLLIYDLMPNGSLDALLHGKGKDRKALDWTTRLKIAVGTARGLSYLHHDCVPHIMHRDIKSSNILLDASMEPKLADFGLATILGPSCTHASTVVAGTFGYLAPEYFETGRATTKGDVYSFGVVLIELLTGKRPTDEFFLEAGTGLVSWVKEMSHIKCIEHAVDSNLICYPKEEVNGMFMIAERCLDIEPSKRPSMHEILKMLEQIVSSSEDGR